MLTYTFSKREKVMLAILAFVGLAILWYRFVFLNVQNRVSELDTQIAIAQEEVMTVQSKAVSYNNMKKAVDEYTEQGLTAAYLPTYDNTQNLMAYLNGVVGSTLKYDIAFEEPELSEEDSLVHRTGTIAFGTKTYEEARSIIDAVERGPYPCLVEAFGITDNTAKKGGGSGNEAPFSTTIKVTFLEKPSAGSSVSQNSGTESKGQDLSQMSNWNK